MSPRLLGPHQSGTVPQSVFVFHDPDIVEESWPVICKLSPNLDWIKFRLCIFGKNTRQVRFYSSQGIVSGHT